MRRISHILVFLILPYLIAACGGNPTRWLNTYEGATLPSDQVANIEYFFFSKKHNKIEIDGKSYTAKTEGEMVHFALMPGKHQINFITSHRGVGMFYGGCEIHMKAGNTYALLTERYNEGTFLRPEYFARGYILNRTTKEKVYC